MDVNAKFTALLLKLEPYAINIFILSMIMNLSAIPYSGIALIIITFTLSMIYVFKSSAKMEQFESLERNLRKGFLTLIAVGLIAILYHLQKWPFDKNMMLVFLFGSSLVAIIGMVKNIQFKKLVSLKEGILFIGLLFIIIASYFDLLRPLIVRP